jgi:hypothetical protein
MVASRISFLFVVVLLEVARPYRNFRANLGRRDPKLLAGSDWLSSLIFGLSIGGARRLDRVSWWAAIPDQSDMLGRSLQQRHRFA